MLDPQESPGEIKRRGGGAGPSRELRRSSRELRRDQEEGRWCWILERSQERSSVFSNSKHWFTTSFLQPLPYVFSYAVFSYAIGSRKLSANEHFFVGAQKVVSLLQTTQIKQGLSFIAANRVYTSTNKTTIG